jgi:hypothetical protein
VRSNLLLDPVGRIAATACSVLGGLGIAILATTSPAGASTSVTFATPGTGLTWVVPAGATSESVALYGAVGGTLDVESGGAVGGDGALVTGTLSLPAGTTLTVDVGQVGGQNRGAINGGGQGDFGSGGGGGSDIRLAGVDQLVAGGGGGGGDFGNPNDASCATPTTTNGGAGGNAETTGGLGEQLTFNSGAPPAVLLGGGGGVAGGSGGAGGAAGTADQATDQCGANTQSGEPGASGSTNQGGGDAGDPNGGGGGGGGGFVGGGQGGGGALDNNDPTQNFAAWGGGGGGSSFGIAGSDPTISDAGNPADGSFNSGNGEVIITYTVGAVTTPTTVPGTPAAGTPAATTTAPATLAFTGADLSPLLIGGGSLIAGGLALLGVTSTRGRHRKRTTSTG